MTIECIDEFVLTLEKLESILYRNQNLWNGIDEEFIQHLTKQQRDRFANNIANAAAELMGIAECIDDEIVNQYK